jgi:hypothetical protein
MLASLETLVLVEKDAQIRVRMKLVRVRVRLLGVFELLDLGRADLEVLVGRQLVLILFGRSLLLCFGRGRCRLLALLLFGGSLLLSLLELRFAACASAG